MHAAKKKIFGTSLLAIERAKARFGTDLRYRKTGFTITELLVVVSIAGTLAAISIPAVQAAREAARRNLCLNNLKQIGLGALLHYEAHQHYPSSGWGHKWVGMPGRGAGRRQPGGWIYNVLPYVDQFALHEHGRDLNEVESKLASAERLQTPLSLFVCPSRRRAQIWPTNTSPPGMPVDVWVWVRDPKHTETVHAVARSDYVINAGSNFQTLAARSMPETLMEGDDPAFRWPKTNIFTGISFIRSEIRAAWVRDGTSNTLMLGEKCLSIANYYNGLDPGDNESMYAGYCTDIARFTLVNFPPIKDPSEMTHTDSLRFGSAHQRGFQAVFCDGSARTIDYLIEPALWEKLGDRADGKVIDFMAN